MKLYVWWLSQEDCEQIEDIVDQTTLAPDIKSEFHSRNGRAGRGRLWVAERFKIESIAWDDTKPLAKAAEKCGGIVIGESDLQSVCGLTGFITDLQLNPINA